MRHLLFVMLLLHSLDTNAENAFTEQLVKARLESSNYAYLLELGDDALLARIHLIRNAGRSIDIQTFIWAPDETGAFMFYELWKAAKRGVLVRLLIDDLSLQSISGSVAYLASLHPNIEIKQYNPLADNTDVGVLQKLGAFTLDFGNSNHRMHNKVVVIDGDFGITGGRNYENDYFDRGTARTFKDRDVLLAGDVVEAMASSFEEYWEDDRSVFSRDMKDVKKDIRLGLVQAPITAEHYNMPLIFDDLSICANSDGRFMK